MNNNDFATTVRHLFAVSRDMPCLFTFSVTRQAATFRHEWIDALNKMTVQQFYGCQSKA